jgi:hypothetical protein
LFVYFGGWYLWEICSPAWTQRMDSKTWDSWVQTQCRQTTTTKEILQDQVSGYAGICRVVSTGILSLVSKSLPRFLIGWVPWHVQSSPYVI